VHQRDSKWKDASRGDFADATQRETTELYPVLWGGEKKVRRGRRSERSRGYPFLKDLWQEPERRNEWGVRLEARNARKVPGPWGGSTKRLGGKSIPETTHRAARGVLGFCKGRTLIDGRENMHGKRAS